MSVYTGSIVCTSLTLYYPTSFMDTPELLLFLARVLHRLGAYYYNLTERSLSPLLPADVHLNYSRPPPPTLSYLIT